MNIRRQGTADAPKSIRKTLGESWMIDGLAQYHKLEKDGVKNANCLAHARRHCTNAIKEIRKGNEKAIRSSVAY